MTLMKRTIRIDMNQYNPELRREYAEYCSTTTNRLSFSQWLSTKNRRDQYEERQARIRSYDPPTYDHRSGGYY